MKPHTPETLKIIEDRHTEAWYFEMLSRLPARWWASVAIKYDAAFNAHGCHNSIKERNERFRRANLWLLSAVKRHESTASLTKHR